MSPLFAYYILKWNYRNFANNSFVILAFLQLKQLDKESLPSLHITSFCLEHINFSKKNMPKTAESPTKIKGGNTSPCFSPLGGSAPEVFLAVSLWRRRVRRLGSFGPWSRRISSGPRGWENPWEIPNRVVIIPINGRKQMGNWGN